MTTRLSSILTLLVVSASLSACGIFGKDKDADAEKKSEDSSAEKEDVDAKKEGAGKKTDDSNAGGNAIAAKGLTEECPKSLAGRESINRLIKKECGIVPVTASYFIDGGTLTLEAGATLAFSDDTELNIGYGKAAKLIVKGTKEDPVTFTASGDKSPGTWKGVRLHQKAKRSIIEGLVLEYAGARKGALLVGATGVEVRNSTFRHVKELGLLVDKEAELAAFEGNHFEDVGKIAIRVSPAGAGQFGEGNDFPEESRIHVSAGMIRSSTTWRGLSVPYLVLGTVKIAGKDGTRASLEIEAGTKIEFDSDGKLIVGYSSEGSLLVKGSVDKPVLFTSNEKREAGAWKGIAIRGKGAAEIAGAVFEYGGADEKKGVLHLVGGTLDLATSTFKDNLVGVILEGKKSTLKSFTANKFENTPVALTLLPDQLRSMAADNTYEGDAKIVVNAGKVEHDATWELQKGARIEIHGKVSVDNAKLTLPEGSAFAIDDGAGFVFGYRKNGSLLAQGTAKNPIVFAGMRDDIGTWKSLTFYGKSHGNVLEHIVIKNAGKSGGLDFRAKSDGKVDTLICEKCEGEAVTVHKKAKVSLSQVSAR